MQSYDTAIACTGLPTFFTVLEKDAGNCVGIVVIVYTIWK